MNHTYLDLYRQPLIIAISRFMERNFYTWFTILLFTFWFGLCTLDTYYSTDLWTIKFDCTRQQVLIHNIYQYQSINGS